MAPRWSGDSIAFQLENISSGQPVNPGKGSARCLNCNIVHPEFDVHFTPSGRAALYVPESRGLITMQLRLEASGVDTAFRMLQPEPEEAMKWYRLSRPLTGRALVTQMSILYADSLQETTVTTLDPGDAINFFEEGRYFYLVHHPLFESPLYLLKNGAIRIR